MYRWDSFTKRIAIHCAPSLVFGCFATARGMESWFLRVCEYTDAQGKVLSKNEIVKVGDLYTFYWHGWPDTVFERGEILEIVDEKSIRFTFNGNGETNMIVLVEIGEEGKHTMLSLTQYNIGEDDHSRSHWHIGCMTGWIFYMTNLKSILEGGIDLRNMDVGITDVINA